jgi:DNA invertase Pin-like site-specific DNA recombinase
VFARGVMTDETGLAIGRQLDECRAYVASHGWDLAGEFVDDGVSGAASSRPALTCILDEVCAGRVQAVVVSKLEVLGRSALLLGNFDAHGVAFVSVAAGIDSGSQACGSSARRFSRFNELHSREFFELGDEYRWKLRKQRRSTPPR